MKLTKEENLYQIPRRFLWLWYRVKPKQEWFDAIHRNRNLPSWVEKPWQDRFLVDHFYSESYVPHAMGDEEDVNLITQLATDLESTPHFFFTKVYNSDK